MLPSSGFFSTRGSRPAARGAALGAARPGRFGGGRAPSAGAAPPQPRSALPQPRSASRTAAGTRPGSPGQPRAAPPGQCPPPRSRAERGFLGGSPKFEACRRSPAQTPVRDGGRRGALRALGFKQRFGVWLGGACVCVCGGVWVFVFVPTQGTRGERRRLEMQTKGPEAGSPLPREVGGPAAPGTRPPRPAACALRKRVGLGKKRSLKGKHFKRRHEMRIY